MGSEETKRRSLCCEDPDARAVGACAWHPGGALVGLGDPAGPGGSRVLAELLTASWWDTASALASARRSICPGGEQAGRHVGTMPILCQGLGFGPLLVKG